MSRHRKAYVISYHGTLSRHVICQDYRGIPTGDKAAINWGQGCSI